MPLTPLQENKEDIQKDLDTLNTDIEKLKTAYEQYFLGMERIEPLKLRKKVLDMVKRHAGTTLQSARQKFRLQQLIARFNTFSTHWDRILKEIEEGRYGRDVFKWKIHQSQAAGVAPKGAAIDPMKDLFNKYLTEKKKCNEDVKALSFDKFKTQMETQIQTLRQKTGAAVRLVVVSEGGKAKIKAVAAPPAQKK